MHTTNDGRGFCFGDTAESNWADVLELMQTARDGSPLLDARIDCVLFGRLFIRMGCERRYLSVCIQNGGEPVEMEPDARWSEDVMASLQLIPRNYNYSIGRRDGVCWAWIQPNDSWTPIGTQYRHDHPHGSGLVVAYTMPLALMAAAMELIRNGIDPAHDYTAVVDAARDGALMTSTGV